MSLSFVNQVGAPRGMNVAAPGSFIPEDFVRWSQDVLFDRVGYLRRRAPYSTLSLFNASGTALEQPSVDKQRVIGVISTRNPANENVTGTIVTDGNTSRVLFYDSQYRKADVTEITTVRADTIMFSRPALTGGLFFGLLENYGVANSSNKNLLYYWRGGTGLDGYTVNSTTLGVTNADEKTASFAHNTDTFTSTAHGLAVNYRITITDAGGSAEFSVGDDFFVIASGLTANEFKVSTTKGGSSINFSSDVAALKFVVGTHTTYTNTITGSFDTTKLSAGMFVYRVASGTDERYVGVLSSWATDGSSITLEKDIIRTYGYEAAAYENTSADVKFVNVRPYVHCHGRGLITRAASGTSHSQTVTSGTIGSDGEGHFASADLAGTVKWALYRASDGEWIGDVESITNNAALTLSGLAHSENVPMNADEYIARPYTSVSQSNDATSYTGIFNTTYAGYQWFANGGAPGTENRIVFSAYHDPEAVDLSKDAADSIIIPGTQQMRGIATSLAGLVIFLEDKTYLLRGNYRSNFSLEELYPEGCLSAQSIVEYGGGVFWASKNGILFFDGATVRNLTESNLGAYYTDSIKTFDSLNRRIYGFFYKDYLFMTFTGFASNYTPLRYEPVYADGIATTPAIADFQADDWDPDFTPDDFRVENNVPIYWKSYNMYASSGASQQNSSGLWSAGTSYPDAVINTGDATVTGLSGIVDPDDVGKTILGYGIPPGTTVLSVTSATEIEMSDDATEDFDPSVDGPASFQIISGSPTSTWSKSLQFVWGPVNFIEAMTFAIYVPTNAITAISNFDFRGFIKLDSAGGTKGYAGINAVNPDGLIGTYARLVDVDSMLNPINNHTTTIDSELSENLGKQLDLYYKGPDFYLQTKHYPVGDPVLKKWFRQVMLNIYLLDGGVRMDVVDMEDNDRIDVAKKRHVNWESFEEFTFSWKEFENFILPKLLSPNRSTWQNVEAKNITWYSITDSEFTRRKKKISWRYPSAGFRLYQMNDYRPSNYQSSKRPHTFTIDSWNIGFRPLRRSRV